MTYPEEITTNADIVARDDPLRLTDKTLELENTAPKHSPTPWGPGACGYATIDDAKGQPIARCFGVACEAIERRDYIIACVNTIDAGHVKGPQ